MKKRYLLLSVILAGLITAAWFWQQQQQKEQQKLDALTQKPAADFRLHIPRGTSLTKIAALAAADLPIDARMFITLTRHLNIATSLQAGVYDFRAEQTIKEILQDIAAGKTAVEKITLVEGHTFAQWRTQLRQDKRLKQLLPELSDSELRATLNISEEHLEGMFLPDTYFFQPGDSDLSILRRSHRQLKKLLTEQWQQRHDDGILATAYEALILASIVEKETGKADERPLIASVFLNRLKSGIRLQADPTIIYGLGDEFDGNLTRAHLRKQDTPYNTYMRAGLPPTPIAIAGTAAIKAVFNPADSDYIYFVAKGDGSHHFSKTLRQHNNAVNRYQRRKK